MNNWYMHVSVCGYMPVTKSILQMNYDITRNHRITCVYVCVNICMCVCMCVCEYMYVTINKVLQMILNMITDAYNNSSKIFQ